MLGSHTINFCRGRVVTFIQKNQSLLTNLAILLGLAVFVSSTFSLAASAPRAVAYSQQRCSSPIQVKIGRHLFLFPRDGGDIFISSALTFPCNKIIQTSSAYFFPGTFLGKSGRLPTEIGPEGFAIELGVGKAGDSDKADTYIKLKVREKLEKAGVDVTQLPLEDGFYTFHVPRQNLYFFIAADMKTPTGNPVTFRCSKAHPLREPLRCGTGFAWKEGVAFWMEDFTTTFVPKKEWQQFYRGFLGYMEGLEQISRR